MNDATNRLNVYLIKPEFTSFDEIVGDGIRGIAVQDVGTLYLVDSKPRQPDWVADFFGDALNGRVQLLTSNAKGVLLCAVDVEEGARIFAIVFGHGRYLLNDGVVEERFGLKVVLNSVRPNSLRSIDKTTLGSTPKQSREQISREGSVASFGIDIEQDLVNAVTGASEDPRLGRTISGRDSVAFSAKCDIRNVSEFLRICWEKYKSEKYKEDFDWIDQIKMVRSTQEIDSLNSLLIQKLNQRDLENIWMASPDILDWVNVKGFRFGGARRAHLLEDIDLIAFLAYLDTDEIELDKLKSTRVFAISARDDEPSNYWSAYKCIYAELDHKGAVFLLNNGKWYEIAKGFTESILREFQEMPEAEIELIDYRHSDEGAYNVALSESVDGSCCLDAQNIPFGGGHSSIEFCDVLTPDKRLLHVKRYSGSTQLSHLFAQGVVSGELFIQDAEFRRKLNERLPDAFKLADVAQQPVASEYEIVFAIISKSAAPLEIPFFSKVTLKNAKQRLRGYGYRVTKKKIQRIAAA